MDSCARISFGIGLTPSLFILGYEPLQVVPILLISKAITGFTSGFSHQEFGNVNFKINKGIGAGGYGPVVMLGQIFSGIYEKTATAITIRGSRHKMTVPSEMLELLDISDGNKLRWIVFKDGIDYI